MADLTERFDSVTSASQDRHEDHQPDLRRLAGSAPVVIFCSSLTDVRPLTERLAVHGVRHRLVTMGMGSARMRERFHSLQALTGWHTLPQIFVDGRFIGGYQEFFKHELRAPGKSPPRVPSPAWWLGAGGLIPFIAGAAGLWIAPIPWREGILALMLIYSAVILSFVGAVHWGLALRDTYEDRELWPRLGLSVLPALAGWAALLADPAVALGLLAVMFSIMYFVDSVVLRTEAPLWYGRLRSWLSAGVVLSLLAALLAVGSGFPGTDGLNSSGTGYGQDPHGERGTGSALAVPARTSPRSIVF